jgi:hypothetical protein
MSEEQMTDLRYEIYDEKSERRIFHTSSLMELIAKAKEIVQTRLSASRSITSEQQMTDARYEIYDGESGKRIFYTSSREELGEKAKEILETHKSITICPVKTSKAIHVSIHPDDMNSEDD